MLRSPEVDDVRLADVSDPFLLDPAWQSLLEEARSEAHRIGYDEGRLAAQQDVVAEAARAVEALSQAVDVALDEMRRHRDEAASALLTNALDLVEKIVGDLRIDPTHLTERLRSALEQVDSPRLEVKVAPALVEFVTEALADDSRVVVAPDSGLGDGEARIVGDWCDADLTWPTVMDVLREVTGA